MINFHKFGFLDAKKLYNYTINKDIWIREFNPCWLFIWSDLYKPEIAFFNQYVFIRVYVPQIGICYYPPFGSGTIEEGLRMILADCKAMGLDYNIFALDDNTNRYLKTMNYKTYLMPSYNDYIYSIDDVMRKYLKKSQALKFEKNHKNLFYKKVKKEDFPIILEYVESYHQSHLSELDSNYFKMLNALKIIMNHLYEFDLLGIILCDEENIYGVAFGSFMNNTAYLELIFTNSEIGCFEECLIAYLNEALLKAKYLNTNFDMFKKYMPIEIAHCYSTINIEEVKE